MEIKCCVLFPRIIFCYFLLWYNFKFTKRYENSIRKSHIYFTQIQQLFPFCTIHFVILSLYWPISSYDFFLSQWRVNWRCCTYLPWNNYVFLKNKDFHISTLQFSKSEIWASVQQCYWIHSPYPSNHQLYHKWLLWLFFSLKNPNPHHVLYIFVRLF